VRIDALPKFAFKNSREALRDSAVAADFRSQGLACFRA
jgi:hypothetical protein